MEKRTLVSIIGLAALICNACGASPTEPTATSFALRGIVTGYEAAALQGAIVEVIDGVNKGKSVVTDAQGRYGFIDRAPGGFTVQATAVDSLVTSLAWSAPPDAMLRPGDRSTYEFCCLARDQAAAVTTYNANYKWVTVHCT